MTKEQRKNLEILADYIATVPQEQFDMKEWRSSYNDLGEIIQGASCGTLGCIIGCAALSNIPELHHNNQYLLFTTYMYDKFGTGFYSHIGQYLFNSDWHKIDNTPIGASKRIKYFLENGLPDTWEEELNGETKLSYL